MNTWLYFVSALLVLAGIGVVAWMLMRLGKPGDRLKLERDKDQPVHLKPGQPLDYYENANKGQGPRKQRDG